MCVLCSCWDSDESLKSLLCINGSWVDECWSVWSPHACIRHVRGVCSFHQAYFIFWQLYIGWSDVTVICGHITISMLCSNKAYCVKLSGDDLSHYLNKIEINWFKKMSTLWLSYQESDVTITNIYQSLPPHHGGKTAGMLWRIMSLSLSVIRSHCWDLQHYDNLYSPKHNR